MGLALTMQRAITLDVAAGTLCRDIEPVAVTIGFQAMKDRGIPTSRLHRAAYRWGSANRPQRLTTNLRPGPALFLGWLATYHHWPLTVVRYQHDYEQSPPQWRTLIGEVVDQADEVIEASSAADRDARVLELGFELTLEELGIR